MRSGRVVALNQREIGDRAASTANDYSRARPAASRHIRPSFQPEALMPSVRTTAQHGNIPAARRQAAWLRRARNADRFCTRGYRSSVNDGFLRVFRPSPDPSPFHRAAHPTRSAPRTVSARRSRCHIHWLAHRPRPSAPDCGTVPTLRPSTIPTGHRRDRPRRSRSPQCPVLPKVGKPGLIPVLEIFAATTRPIPQQVRWHTGHRRPHNRDIAQITGTWPKMGAFEPSHRTVDRVIWGRQRPGHKSFGPKWQECWVSLLHVLAGFRFPWLWSLSWETLSTTPWFPRYNR